MSRPGRRSRVQIEPKTGNGTGFRAWADSRATVLVAMGLLVALVAILVVISLIHPR